MNELHYAYIIHRHGDCVLSVDDMSGSYYWDRYPRSFKWFRPEGSRSAFVSARRFLFDRGVTSGLAIDKGCYIQSVDFSNLSGLDAKFFSENFFDALAMARNAGMNITDVDLWPGAREDRSKALVELASGEILKVDRGDRYQDNMAEAIYSAIKLHKETHGSV